MNGKEKVTVSFEVEFDLYEKAKETLRQIAVTPEYATLQFIKECVKRKDLLISRFKAGECAEDLIAETADATLAKIVQETMNYRKLLSELKIVEREVSITELRMHWGKNLKWIETPGNVLLITRNKKREVALISVKMDLAVTSMATDDKTIQNRCAILEML